MQVLIDIGPLEEQQHGTRLQLSEGDSQLLLRRRQKRVKTGAARAGAGTGAGVGGLHALGIERQMSQVTLSGGEAFPSVWLGEFEVRAPGVRLAAHTS